MNTKFDTLSLHPELLKTLQDLDFKAMTQVQAKALPVVLDGHDVLAQAKTGSGKTAVFGLSILNKIDLKELYPQSLILCPTRELAEQVAREIRNFGRLLLNLRVLTLCGGLAQQHQEKSLAYGAHIIVGTPGRVLQLLKNTALDIKKINSFVLDEADKMLEMGFQEDILEIKKRVPATAQTLLFSATFPQEIKSFAQTIQTNGIPIEVDFDHDEGVIEQRFYQVESHKKKNDALLAIISEFKLQRFIVFCKTKRITDDVANFLNEIGIQAASIHGDLEQNERTAVLTKFSNKSLIALVATDVAARGLDIESVSSVINYDLPQDLKSYVHRIGRTARAGASGDSFSFFVRQEEYKLEQIAELIKFSPQVHDINELKNSEPFRPRPAMKTMYMGGGKKDKLRVGDIVGALVHEAKLDPSDIGDIAVMNITSLVAIKSDKAAQAITALTSGKIKKKKFKVGLA